MKLIDPPLSKPTVLITGSAGFVGHHLVRHILNETDWNIVGLDSFSHKGDSLRVIRDPRYRVFCTDLAGPISPRLANLIGDITYIINAASESHVDRSIEYPVETIKNNTALIVNMLEYARTIKNLKAFIQISTDEVYGAAPNGYNHKEWDMILPSNPYSASKAAQEAIAIAYWRTYGIPLMITNTMNMFGETQDPEKYIPGCIKKIASEQTVTVHGNATLIGSRKYLHALNHADALLFILKNVIPSMYKFDPTNTTTCIPTRFNVVGDVEMNNFEVAKLIANLMGKQLKYQFQDFHALSTRPGHDMRYSLDGTMLAKLGWKAPFSFEESIQKTIQFYQNHREWLL